jgi:hypothetical protein
LQLLYGIAVALLLHPLHLGLGVVTNAGNDWSEALLSVSRADGSAQCQRK